MKEKKLETLGRKGCSKREKGGRGSSVATASMFVVVGKKRTVFGLIAENRNLERTRGVFKGGGFSPFP